MIAIRSRFNAMTLNYQLMVLLIGLNIVDFMTTKILVDRLGFLAEANTLLLWAMIAMGSVYAILGIKVITLSFLWWIVGQIQDHHKRITPERLTRILQVIVVAFFALITYNFTRVFQELNII